MTAGRDLVVVGAGFAGLACARRAAQRGLSVRVIDRKSEPGSHVHTTGILVREAWEAWPAPERLVHRISRVRVYTPSHRFIDIERDGYFFMATDTAGLLRHLAAETRAAGAEVRFGQPFSPDRDAAGHTASADSAQHLGQPFPPPADAAPFLVGADGARSAVAAHFGLDRNTRLLKGVEWEFEPVPAAGDCLHCFVDPECAPGYIGWVVPGVGRTQVGIAVHEDRRADLRRFIARIDPLFGLSGKRVIERRGGLIPIGGRLRRTHAEGVVLIGDAAGMVSPLTAGGIQQSYLAGRLAGDAVADYLAAGRTSGAQSRPGVQGSPGDAAANGEAPHPGEVLRRSHGGDGWKRWARWGYDHLPVAAALEAGAMGVRAFRRIAERVFFDAVPGRVGVIAALAFVAACGSGVQGGSPAAADSAAESAPSMTLLLRGGRRLGRLEMSPAFVVTAPPALPQASGPYELAGSAADGTRLFGYDFDMTPIADGAPDEAGFTFAIPAPSSWAGVLARIELSGPEGSYQLTPDSEPPEYIIFSSETGRIAGILRGETGRAAAEAARAGGSLVLTSRGVPDAAAWRREGQ